MFFGQRVQKKEAGESVKRRQPWVDKYRPKVLDDVAHQEEAVSALRQGIKSGNLNHLLFYGPPGTGKTSTILAAAYELYGPLKKDRLLELNASDERGINIIRQKVKGFAKGAVGNRKVEGHPCPPYKIIILDECDSMTGQAQAALRRTMEEYSKTTRFCLICNYVTRIIPPVASRCAKFRFRLVPEEAMVKKLTEICEKEKLNVSKETCQSLIEVSRGDMRKCINLLQSAKQLKKDGEAITVDDVFRVSVCISDDVIQKVVAVCQQPQFQDVLDLAEDIVLDGHPISLLFEKLVASVSALPNLTDLGKAKTLLSISKAEAALHMQGADEKLQLQKVLGVLATQFKDQLKDIEMT